MDQLLMLCGHTAPLIMLSGLKPQVTLSQLLLNVRCREYEMVSAAGTKQRLDALMMHNSVPVAYGALPCENVVYVGCHDNETLFDQVCSMVHSVLL